MDSRFAFKNKKKLVSSHRRRISSILNQSPTKLNASKGDINRKISVLIKNNKTLAVALEDAQCELSSKQKLLEKASEYFKTIMLARVKMTQMWSALNAVLQDFDVTMEMLKCDSFKLSDITPPFQSSGKLKKKMKKIAEAVISVNEESSFLFEQGNEESDCGKSADAPSSRKYASSNLCPVLMEVTENIADKTSSSLEPAILQASIKNCLPDSSSPDPVTPGSSCAKSEALIDPGNKKEMTSVTSDILIARNDTGTPKLSLPSALPMIDLQNNSGIAFSLLKEKDSSIIKKLSKTPEKKSGDPVSLLKENDLSVKKFSKIPEALNKPKSSQKVLNSKIPKFRASRNTVIKETSLPDELSKGKSACPGIFNKKNVSIPKEMNEIDSRRKTFVVKSSDPETAVDLNEEEVADMNNLEDEQNSETFTSRKTFVVRSSSALENKRKSLNNKRKTFVKKCNKNNSPKSIKNRRGTFVLTAVNENCTEEGKLLTAYSVNSECDDLVKEESNKPCAVSVPEAFPPDSNDPCEITQNLQLSKNNCFIIDNIEMKNQKSNYNELFLEVNSEGTLKHKLENSSAVEKKCKSVNNERKTFVKKCDKNNSCKSIKNKRGTFVLTDIDENCTEEDQLLTNLVNSECDDLVKEKFSQKSKSKELLPEVSSDVALMKNLVKSPGIKDVKKLICNKEDTTIVKFEKQVGEINDVKSTILPQNPSIELRVQADKNTNEAARNTSEAKASKEEKNNCTADGMECNKGNLLLKNSNRRKSCLTLSQEKHNASIIGTPEKEPAVPQTSSQESERKYVLEIEVNNNEEGESSLKSIETNEKCKSGIKDAIDGNKRDETNEKNLGLIDISDEEIIILDNDKKKRRSSSRKKISYKMFLEPSYSDCESISEVENFENFEDEINSYSMAKTPVRGKVSFSKKKNYVFNREADKKIKPKKYPGKSKNCKNLSNELASASALNRNCEDNLNKVINQISDENVGKSSLLHFANPKGKKTEISSKRHVKFCDTQERMLNAVKIIENSVHNKTNTDIKIDKNSLPEILEVQNHKNVNKTILAPNYSPVISLDKCLNNIECDIGDKIDKSDKINFSDKTIPEKQNIEADNANNIKKRTDSVNDKTSKRKEPKRNRPKKKKKQVIESDVEKENIEDSQVHNKNEMKPKSKNNKEKKLAKNNAIVVEAEVHPLPRTLNQLDTNIENTMNYEVSVVLNDIFQSKLTDLLCVNNKENRDRNCVISSPLSNNSRNIQMQATNNCNATKEGDNEDLTECRRSKRARAINYAEPTLNKKLRRDR